MENNKVISLDKFREKKKAKKKNKFDPVAFARKKLLEDNPNNIKYL